MRPNGARALVTGVHARRARVDGTKIWFVICALAVCVGDGMRRAHAQPQQESVAWPFLAALPDSDSQVHTNIRVAMELAEADFNQLSGSPVPLEMRPVNYTDDSNILSAVCALVPSGVFGIVGAPGVDDTLVLHTTFADVLLPIFTFTLGATGSATQGSNVYDVVPGTRTLASVLKRFLIRMKDQRDVQSASSSRYVGLTEIIGVIYEDGLFSQTIVPSLMAGDSTDIPFDENLDIVLTAVYRKGAGVDELLAPLTLVQEQDVRILIVIVESDSVELRLLLELASNMGLMSSSHEWYFVQGTSGGVKLLDPKSSASLVTLRQDMIGSLGVLPCAQERASWAAFAPRFHEAGGALSADGTIPWQALYAYDAVWLLGLTLQRAAQNKNAPLEPYARDSCLAEGVWEDGELFRSALANTTWSRPELLTGPMAFDQRLRTRHVLLDEEDRYNPTFCISNNHPDVLNGGLFVNLDRFDREGMFSRISPRFPQRFPQLAQNYPFDRAAATGRTLRVAVNHAPPFNIIQYENGGFLVLGINGQVIIGLARRLGFTYEFVEAYNATVNDLVDMVDKGEADLAMSWSTISASRLEKVDFTTPYHDVTLCFAIRIGGTDLEEDIWGFINPFSWQIWLAIFLFLFLVTTCFFALEGVHGNFDFTDKNYFSMYGRSCYISFALLLNQLSHEPQTVSGYVLTTGWLIFAFIVTASYVAELASFLVGSDVESLFSRGIVVLRDGTKDVSAIGVLDDGATEAYIRNHVIGCGSECTEQDMTYMKCADPTECYQAVIDGKIEAFVTDAPIAMYSALTEYCGQITVTGASFHHSNYGMMLPRNSALADDFNRILMEMREDGSLAAATQNYLPDASTCSADETLRPFTITSLGGLFIIVGVIMGVGFTIWVLRISGALAKIQAWLKKCFDHWGLSKATELPEDAKHRSKQLDLQRKLEVYELVEEYSIKRTEPSSFDKFDADAYFASREQSKRLQSLHSPDLGASSAWNSKADKRATVDENGQNTNQDLGVDIRNSPQDSGFTDRTDSAQGQSLSNFLLSLRKSPRDEDDRRRAKSTIRPKVSFRDDV
ncbi:Glutamate receptor ionotropic, delta-1 [Porphyridium purpureum]|uniref:Glutamate receptor ionotropic, delta-1 n=1 Tax=Porphyridium purpureum TaxID=35688 RepID=A0A5J4YXE4_PORPP|nr:Glutamate receptor ionotropic, delta-1 [Porphyridium purpureum]|eukprot:POR6694..scf209_3